MDQCLWYETGKGSRKKKWILKKILQQSLKRLSQVMTQKSLKKLPDLS